MSSDKIERFIYPKIPNKLLKMFKKNVFKNKDILVTGGCGSVGSELVKQLLNYNPKRIKILDNNESGQFHLKQELAKFKKVRYLIGDVRDKDRIKRAIKGVNIVFHAAALKHVPLCEYNPFEALNTNVLGTQNMIDAAREAGVEKFILISTDKAVNPINTMGATKLLGEKLVISSAGLGDWNTLFSCVRFGNVLNSDGSVIPIFKEQIKKGGPVTITSAKMTRFFMSMPQAVELILNSAKKMKGREIFILKMKALRIIDLANVMITELATKYGHDPNKIKIKKIGVRPGEKLYESLITEEETHYISDIGKMFILTPGSLSPHDVEKAKKSKINISQYNSKDIQLLTKKEIKDLIQKERII